MPEPSPAQGEGRARIEQSLVAGIAAAAIAAFAGLPGAHPALLGLVPLLVSFAWRPARVPRWVTRFAPGLLRIALGSVFLMRVALTLYPVLDDDRVAGVALATGALLVPLLALATLGTRIWPPAWAALPLSIGLLAVASFDPSPRVRWAQIAEAGLALLYLALAAPRLEARGGGRAGRRAAAVLAFAALAAVAALGLAWLLPWLQPHVEDAAADLLNPSFPVAQAGFSANSRLGDIERLAVSRSVVLRVWTPSPRRLRGRVLTAFDGRSWQASRPAWHDLKWASPELLPADLGRWLGALPGRSFGDVAAARRPGTEWTRVAPAVVVADTLFAPGGVALAHVASTRLRTDRFGILEAPDDPTAVYALVHGAAPAGEAPGPDALAVPADIDPRLVELAARLAEGDPSPATRVARTCVYLARQCRYALDVGPFVSRQPVAEFVFDKRRGYCEYFASAAALLLRLEGVPTRYVTGFSMDAAEELGGHYVIRESDAHAWIEVWIRGQGWVEQDPTPSADYAAVHAGRGSVLERQLEWLRDRFAEAVRAAKTRDLRALARALAAPIGVLAAVALAVAARPLWRARRRTAVLGPHPGLAWAGDAELAEVVARLESLWARAGCPRPAHRAPLEHLRQLPPGRLPRDLARASQSVLASYYAARYGGREVPRATVRALARELEEVRP